MLSALLLVSVYIFLVSVNLHIQFINFPYQHEYREGAVLTVTGHYVNNENPFDIIYQPQDTYVYGFFYPWIVSLFAKLYGNTLAVHRWITYAFILLSCALIFFALVRMKICPVFSFTAAVILHQSLIYEGLISIARPEGLGIFIFVFGILIPWRFKFSFWACVSSILLGILGFLTKPYYIFVIPIIGIYMFVFVSKRKSVYYGIISTFLFLITAVVIGFIYEVYHNNTFFHQFTAVNMFQHMLKQLLQYTRVNAVLLLIVIFSFIVISRSFWCKNVSGTLNKGFNFIKSKFLYDKSLNIFRNEPLIQTKYNCLFVFAFLFVLFLFVIKLGGNTGNSDGAYLYHLASAFLILSTFQLIEISRNKVFKIIVALLLILTLSRQFNAVEYDFENISNCHKEIENIIKKSNNPLNSPETASIVAEQNKRIYNSGHSEYFHTGVSKISLMKNVSKKIYERETEFTKEVNYKILNKQFDLILLTEGYPNYWINSFALAKNYQCSDTLCARMVYQNWNIEVWYPKK